MRKASRTTAAMDKPTRAPKLEEKRGEKEKEEKERGRGREERENKYTGKE